MSRSDQRLNAPARQHRRRPGRPRRGRRRQTHPRQQVPSTPRSIRLDDSSVQVIGHRMAYRVARNLSSGGAAPGADHIAQALRTAGACAFWALATLTLLAGVTTAIR